MKGKQFGALLLLGAIWGASFLFIKLAVQRPEAPGNFPPLTLVGIRQGLAALVIYGLMRLRRQPFPWHRWRELGVLGLLNAALPWFLFSWGEQHVNSNLAAIYNATTPLWGVLLAWFFVREERLSGLRSIGVAIGFLGVVYLFSGSLAGPRGADRLALWGELACVVAAFSYALSNMWTRRKLRGVEPIALAAGQLIFGTLWTLPFVVTVERPWSLAPAPSAIAALATLSLLGTACAMLLFFWILGQVGAIQAAQVTYLLPIFGLFWGSLIGEPITSRVVASLLLILAGVVVVNGGLEWLLRRGTALRDEGSGAR
jgi:drug/metabolite transporter (DMT)-like permease